MGSEELVSGLLRRLEQRTAKVVIIGQGYVGLPLAMRATEVGYQVVGYETSAERVRSLRAGRSYVEDITDDRLAAALEAGYHPTRDPLDLRGFDVAVITVPTPLRDGAPDLSYIESAGRDVGRCLEAGALISFESTTYPGTTDELLRPILEEGGLHAGYRLLPRLLARAHRPGQPALVDRQHAQGRFRSRGELEAGHGGVLRQHRRQGRSGRDDGRGRAREAAREHVPPRQHRARQRARGVRARARRRHLERDRRRRRRSRSGSCDSRPGPASAVTAFRSTRRISRGGSSDGSAIASVSSSSPTTSIAACPTTSCAVRRRS